MALAYEPPRPDGTQALQKEQGAFAKYSRAGGPPGANTISASQARAARRREALSNQQAVSAWLRELSGRTR
jgi:hypothetical protein